MSAWNTTTLHLFQESIGATELFQFLIANGWVVNEDFLYLPIGEEDDFGWSSEKISISELQKIFAQQVKLSKKSGFYLFNPELSVHAGFVFLSSELEISWGADCPKHDAWPRIVNPVWVLDILRPIVRELALPVAEISFRFDSPL
ncbi:MAG: hypothetical protein MI923_26735 [Phycisphaerales bacterium]|nr:hypothetical protein [Phycisphaerales bacterium]